MNELRKTAPKEPYKLLDSAHRIYTCTQEDAPGTAGLFQPEEWRIVLVRDRPGFENTLVRRYMDGDISVPEYMNMSKDEERLFTLCRKLAARIKDGKREYIEILWNQNQGIIRKIAGRYLRRAQIMRYDFEDLTQECYFALVPSPENLGEDTTERMAMKELAQKYGTTPSRLNLYNSKCKRRYFVRS